MKSAASLVFATIAGLAAAVPTGPLYAQRLPRSFDDGLREVAKRQSGDSFPYNSDVLSYKDPQSNLTYQHTPPTYRALTPFDYASFNLGIYQEYIELDLFNYAIAKFSSDEWADAGMTDADVSLLRFFAQQEIGHATLLGNILGPGHAQSCSYRYDFTTVRDFLDFSQRLTRWGESGVYGFLSHLNSADSATLLTSSIVTEARQQYTFRQFAGAFPVPEAFVGGIPQAWQWTLLAPYITSCPAGTPPITWSNFPALNVTLGDGSALPSLAQPGSKAAVSTNATAPLIAPGTALRLTWDAPGKQVGPDGAYTTATNSSTGVAKYAYFTSQLNATQVPLFDVDGNSATAYVPDFAPVFPTFGVGLVNSTGFVVVADDQAGFYTPYNLTLINTHVIAGPQVVTFG